MDNKGESRKKPEKKKKSVIGIGADSFLPYGFKKISEGETNYYLKGNFAEPLLKSGVLSLDRRGSPTGPTTPFSGGRGTAYKVEVSGVGSVVVRRYRRGGLFGKILKDRYFVPHRALSELFSLTTAGLRGVPTPHALGISEKRRRFRFIPSPFYTALIATSEIAGSVNLPDFLKREGDSRLRSEVLVRAGAAVKKMHDAGIYHRDLNMNNLLVGSFENDLFIIDFDRAKVCDLLSPRIRTRNLRRLLRSARKLMRFGLPTSDDDFKKILSGYTNGDEASCRRLVKRTVDSRLLKIRGRISWKLKRLFQKEKQDHKS